ncbi:MAG: DUF952 domain-containing protein [Bacteroidales bacterium]|nr:DUF952 domain-containing protein [Bacteroidales bacterium]
MKMIFHITTQKDWEKALKAGEYRAPSLQQDGFIHCSTLKQTIETANIFFKGQQGLILLCVDEEALEAPCKYEDPTGGALHSPEAGSLFPHVYGPLKLSAITEVMDFPVDEDGMFCLPEKLMDL